jgi:hypothetical protein
LPKPEISATDLRWSNPSWLGDFDRLALISRPGTCNLPGEFSSKKIFYLAIEKAHFCQGNSRKLQAFFLGFIWIVLDLFERNSRLG